MFQQLQRGSCEHLQAATLENIWRRALLAAARIH
jgi:hypothetical protein